MAQRRCALRACCQGRGSFRRFATGGAGHSTGCYPLDSHYRSPISLFPPLCASVIPVRLPYTQEYVHVHKTHGRSRSSHGSAIHRAPGDMLAVQMKLSVTSDTLGTASYNEK